MKYAIGLASMAFLTLGGSLRAADPPPSFARDIKPFLTRYCLECHSGASAKKNVRVDSHADLLKPGTKGVLVVPGKPEQSLLVLTLEGKKKLMPPRKFAAQPTAAEIARVRAWIAAGAGNDAPAHADDADRPRLGTLRQE